MGQEWCRCLWMVETPPLEKWQVVDLAQIGYPSQSPSPHLRHQPHSRQSRASHLPDSSSPRLPGHPTSLNLTHKPTSLNLTQKSLFTLSTSATDDTLSEYGTATSDRQQDDCGVDAASEVCETGENEMTDVRESEVSEMIEENEREVRINLGRGIISRNPLLYPSTSLTSLNSFTSLPSLTSLNSRNPLLFPASGNPLLTASVGRALPGGDRSSKSPW
eukprot:GHVN01021307.1.p1 GENE.GHVN01021307.1~~GHVN01021307.1.p1  ORF type:complete len:248 (-),score=124.11 GHVN01021307.1:486-1139(-)